jgi:hypothetical protein
MTKLITKTWNELEQEVPQLRRFRGLFNSTPQQAHDCFFWIKQYVGMKKYEYAGQIANYAKIVFIDHNSDPSGWVNRAFKN